MPARKERPVDADPGNTVEPVANTAAVITFAAVAGKRHIITDIHYSYDVAPTGGKLTIKDGTIDGVYAVSITAAGPGFADFRNPLRGEVGNAVSVTLAAGGAGVSGKLNVYKYTE